MESSIYLAKVIGWFLIIVSALLLFRQRSVTAVMENIFNQPGLFFFIALLTVLLGLLMVQSHNVWVMNWTLAVTLIGWFVFLTGILRLVFPEQIIRTGHNWLRKPRFFMILAVIYLVIAVYLLFNAYYPTMVRGLL